MAKLTSTPCANPSCSYVIPASSSTNLCAACVRTWERTRLPVAGYIGSLDLQKVGSKFIREVNPTPSEISAALRILRGSRHRTGPWEERPAYRLTPLMTARVQRRLPHLLVGRRKEPSPRSLGMGLAAYHLGHSILGTTSTYPQYLAGAVFYVRKSPFAPPGVEVLKGTSKTGGYRLHRSDYSAIGRELLKAGEALGVPRDARWVRDRITSIYVESLAAGDCHAPVVLSPWSKPTAAPGDHPWDHHLPALTLTDCPVPPQYRDRLRRASGKIGGEYPVGLDEHLKRTADLRRNPGAVVSAAAAKPTTTPKEPTASTPSTDWLFGG